MNVKLKKITLGIKYKYRIIADIMIEVVNEYKAGKYMNMKLISEELNAMYKYRIAKEFVNCI